MSRYDPLLSRQVRQVTCEDCPLRTSNPTGKMVGVATLKTFINEGIVTCDEVEENMIEGREKENTISQCGKLIVSGNCTAYKLMDDQFYVSAELSHPSEYPGESVIDDYTGQIIED